MELKQLKESYSIIARKHSLVDFERLNDDFEVEKIEGDTETILRVIRKAMMEKIVSSMSFVESLLNPMNTSKIYMPYVKRMSMEDKNTLDEIFSELSKLSLISLNLEIDYSEKSEAEMIKSIFSTWQSLKPKFRQIITNINKPEEKIVRKEKSYFG